jgi:hypothetical protein
MFSGQALAGGHDRAASLDRGRDASSRVIRIAMAVGHG